MPTDSVASKQTVTLRTAKCGLDVDRLAAARKKLDAMGMSIKDWANENGHSYGLTRAILSGAKRCLRGESHEIAVKLNLKDGRLSHG